MTELQNKELQILCEFIRICGELKLSYFLVCGTALGAVKYNGFIPWDDDIDVGMPRDAYEKFMRCAPALLPAHLFLQNSITDPKFPALYSKLRDSNTTYIEKSSAHLPINHGIYIDIFPLDGYPSARREQNKLERLKRTDLLKAQTAYRVSRRFPAKLVTAGFRMLGCHRRTAKIMAHLNAIISKYPIESSALICNHGNWQGKLEYAPREQYGNGILTTFEGLHVRIPERYDEYLTQKYGDWRADLPKELQVGHHYYEVCDLTKPYTYYTD